MPITTTTTFNKKVPKNREPERERMMKIGHTHKHSHKTIASIQSNSFSQYAEGEPKDNSRYRHTFISFAFRMCIRYASEYETLRKRDLIERIFLKHFSSNLQLRFRLCNQFIFCVHFVQRFLFPSVMLRSIVYIFHSFLDEQLTKQLNKLKKQRSVTFLRIEYIFFLFKKSGGIHWPNFTLISMDFFFSNAPHFCFAPIEKSSDDLCGKTKDWRKQRKRKRDRECGEQRRYR